MENIIERWKCKLSLLSAEERAELAHFLIQTLDAESDEEVEAAWEAEITTRVDEIKAGTAPGRPAEQVFAELRTRVSIDA